MNLCPGSASWSHLGSLSSMFPGPGMRLTLPWALSDVLSSTWVAWFEFSGSDSKIYACSHYTTLCSIMRSHCLCVDLGDSQPLRLGIKKEDFIQKGTTCSTWHVLPGIHFQCLNPSSTITWPWASHMTSWASAFLLWNGVVTLCS